VYFLFLPFKGDNMSASLQAIVLATEKSTDFKTGKTKYIEKLCGQEMILYTTRLLQQMKIKSHIVIGYQKENIKQLIIQEHGDYFEFIEQEAQHDTVHAILCSKKKWIADNILIIHGDIPLVESEQIDALYKKHTELNAALTLVTSRVIDSSRNECAHVIKKAGIYIIKKSFLHKRLETFKKHQNNQKFQINDIVNVATECNEVVATIPAQFDTVRGINTLQELWATEQVKRSKLIRHWMDRGVRFLMTQNVHIDLNVTIGAGSFIGSGVHLIGNTIIGNNSSIMEFSSVENSVIGDNVTIEPHCIVRDSTIKNNAIIGPFAHVRETTHIHEKAHVGNFVEVKNSVIGEKTKAKHLAYLGDAHIGKNVNIGAGTIACNHNGKEKNKTTIKDNAYIGSNTALIAPVTIEQNAYVGAGSTITKDVPTDALGIARARQVNKEKYADKLKHKAGNTTKEGEPVSYYGSKKNIPYNKYLT